MANATDQLIDLSALKLTASGVPIRREDTIELTEVESETQPEANNTAPHPMRSLRACTGTVPFAKWWYNNLVCRMLATRAATT